MKIFNLISNSVVLKNFHREPIDVDNNICWKHHKRNQIAEVVISFDEV